MSTTEAHGGRVERGPRAPGLVVRPVRAGEHEALGDLTVAAYAAALGGALSEDYVPVLRAVGRRALTDVVLVATDGDRLLGGVTYVADAASPNAEFPAPTDAGIRYLAVHPGVQGRGVGERLVRACLARAGADGKRRIVLHTQREMAAAQRLYARLGFMRSPELDWDPLPGLRLIAFTHVL